MLEKDMSELRVGRITASRIAGILGISPMHSRESVLRGMVRQFHGAEQEFTGNVLTQYGHDHESDAIGEYEQYARVMVDDRQQTFVHPDYDFLAATPDGLVEDGLVEVKCPWRGKYRRISERPDYEAQVRLQIACTGRAWGDFVVWVEGEGITVSRVVHDPEWLPSILPTLLAFMEDYQTIIADDELSKPFLEPLKDERSDDEWAVKAQEWLEAKYAADRALEQLDKAKQEMLNLTEKPAKGAGVQVIRKSGRKTTKWSQFAKEHDLEPGDEYVSVGAPIWEVRRAAS